MTNMSWTRVGTWVAVLAIIGIVLSGIHLASLTDPGGRDIDYPSGKEAVRCGGMISAVSGLRGRKSSNESRKRFEIRLLPSICTWTPHGATSSEAADCTKTLTGVITVELLDRSAWDQVPFGNDVSVTILGDHEGIFTWRQDLDRWYPTAGQRERGTLASFLPPLVDPRPTTFRRAPTTMPEPQQADSLASQPLGESGESTEVPKPPRKPGGPTTRSEGQEDSFPRKIPS